MDDRSIDGIAADDSFVAGLLDGTAAAFETLVDRYHYRLTVYLVRMLGDIATAEDVAQDTFEAMFTSLHTLTDDRSFNAWLFTIARNKAVPHLRRRMILQFVPLDSVVTLVGGWLGRNPEDAFEDVSTRDDIQAVLDRMSTKEREALLLHSAARFTSRQIAGILGITPRAAAARVYRSRQRFAALYLELTGLALPEPLVPGPQRAGGEPS